MFPFTASRDECGLSSCALRGLRRPFNAALQMTSFEPLVLSPPITRQRLPFLRASAAALHFRVWQEAAALTWETGTCPALKAEPNHAKNPINTRLYLGSWIRPTGYSIYSLQMYTGPRRTHGRSITGRSYPALMSGNVADRKALCLTWRHSTFGSYCPFKWYTVVMVTACQFLSRGGAVSPSCVPRWLPACAQTAISPREATPYPSLGVQWHKHYTPLSQLKAQ